MDVTDVKESSSAAATSSSSSSSTTAATVTAIAAEMAKQLQQQQSEGNTSFNTAEATVTTPSGITVTAIANLTEENIDDEDDDADDDDDEVMAECTTVEIGHETIIKNSLIKCALCGKTFVSDDNPKLLECLHAACTACINAKLTEHHDADIIHENVISCQLCNVDSQAQNLIENRFYTKFLEDDMDATCDDDNKEEEENKCTNCSENAIATSWCVECEEFICQNCVMAHQRLKITKDHTIKPKEDVPRDVENNKKGEKKNDASSFCTVHLHEQLTLFCTICDQLTCRDCQLSEHRDHKYKFIHEIAAETRTSVKTLLNEVSYKRELLKSAMKVIEDRQVLISEKKKTLIDEITQMVVQLTNAVNSRGKQLILRLSEVCEQKQNTLNEKKIALDQLSKLTDHCIDFVNYALDKGTDMELLYSKKSVTNHLQRIKSKRADIPNPEIPVRIHLSMEKVQDLIKVISSIGAIVVDGRVYPSVTPPSEPSAPTTPISEPIESKPMNPCAMNIAMDTSPVAQTMSMLPTQQANNIPHNSYLQQPINIPISTQQVSLQTQQHLANQQQIQSQAQSFIQHYNMQRASPQGQRMPSVNYNYNGRMPPQQQQQQMMMNQRPGLGNCHQQVTSSTHPHQQQLHIPQVQQPPEQHLNQQNASLRGLLAHNAPPAYRANQQSNSAVQAVAVVAAQQYGRFPPRYPINRYAGNVQQQRPVGPPQQQVYQQQSGGSILANTMQIRQGGPMLNVYQQQQQQQQQMMQQQQQQQQQQQHQQQHQQQQQQQQQQSQSARWHIPQNVNSQGPPPPNYPRNQQRSGIGGPVNDTYKITLKNQPAVSAAQQTKSTSNTASPSSVTTADNSGITNNQNNNSTTVSHTVSSSMPKTPSPASHEKTEETQKSLDKFCQKSLNDLMLTIAKLDSNGIVVIPEAQKNQMDSTQVDSSTDEGVNAMTDNSSATTVTKDDPNEDWCAVCMDGGDAVLCCDKCPKVFHLYCHIPKLETFPHESETWQCMLCTNVLECPDDPPGEKRTNELSTRDLKIAQRIILELYCQYEQSLPFREVVSPEITEYHRIIKKPIALDIIRDKLKPENENRYTDLKQLMADLRLMFKNAYTYNPVDSQVYQEARSLEEFFEKLLTKWAPAYAYDDFTFHAGENEEDEEVFPPNRKYRRIIND